jgi:cytochrome c oxidase subunit 4
MDASNHDTTHVVRTYLKVFAALMVLTVVTVAVSYLHLTVPLAIGVALAVAILKGSLVASFFMHLISERPVIFFVLLGVGVLFVALMALPVLTAKDSIGTPSTPWTSMRPRPPRAWYVAQMVSRLFVGVRHYGGRGGVLGGPNRPVVITRRAGSARRSSTDVLAKPNSVGFGDPTTPGVSLLLPRPSVSVSRIGSID